MKTIILLLIINLCLFNQLYVYIIANNIRLIILDIQFISNKKKEQIKINLSNNVLNEHILNYSIPQEKNNIENKPHGINNIDIIRIR